MMTKNFYIAAFVVSMLAFSSCKIGKRYARPELNLPDRIEAYTDTTDTASVENIPWESLYADETLKDLIKKALDNNKDMKIAAAKALAALAGEDIQSYAEQMFEAGADLTGRTAEDVFSSDFKAFSRGDVKFGVGQSTYMTDKSRAAAEALVQPFLPEASRREGLPLIFYMFTDMKTQSTDLMFYGHNAEEIIRDAFHVEPEGNIAKLPGVVSRKKQLIPPLLAALQARQ